MFTVEQLTSRTPDGPSGAIRRGRERTATGLRMPVLASNHYADYTNREEATTLTTKTRKHEYCKGAVHHRDTEAQSTAEVTWKGGARGAQVASSVSLFLCGR